MTTVPESHLIIGIEGSGSDGFHIFASRSLQCVLVGRSISDHYDSNLTWGDVATRRLSPVWITWLRHFHSATVDDCREFGRLVKLIEPDLAKASAPVPRGYLPPYSYKSFCFGDE